MIQKLKNMSRISPQFSFFLLTIQFFMPFFFSFSFSQTILLWEDRALDSIKLKILMLSFSEVVLNRKAGRKAGRKEGSYL